MSEWKEKALIGRVWKTDGEINGVEQ